MLKIPQARLQQYVNQELPDVQARFRKGRGIRDQTANIHWIIEKERELKKKKEICFLTTLKPLYGLQHLVLDIPNSNISMKICLEK